MIETLNVRNTLEKMGVMTSEKFSIEVERRWMNDPDPERSLLSHAAQYLEELGIDQEDSEATKLISPSLYAKIHAEASSRNMLKTRQTHYSLI